MKDSLSSLNKGHGTLALITCLFQHLAAAGCICPRSVKRQVLQFSAQLMI